MPRHWRTPHSARPRWEWLEDVLLWAAGTGIVVILAYLGMTWMGMVRM